MGKYSRVPVPTHRLSLRTKLQYVEGRLAAYLTQKMKDMQVTQAESRAIQTGSVRNKLCVEVKAVVKNGPEDISIKHLE